MTTFQLALSAILLSLPTHFSPSSYDVDRFFLLRKHNHREFNIAKPEAAGSIWFTASTLSEKSVFGFCMTLSKPDSFKTIEIYFTSETLFEDKKSFKISTWGNCVKYDKPQKAFVIAIEDILVTESHKIITTTSSLVKSHTMALIVKIDSEVVFTDLLKVATISR